MTVLTIETVQGLIEEMQAEGTMIGSVWEYTNIMNNKKMFAVFPARQFCDIRCSSAVKDPKIIWEFGKYVGKYAHLN